MRTVLITGSTDGIGLHAARALHAAGHRVLLHGRSEAKLQAVRDELGVPGFLCDLSSLADTRALADAVAAAHPELDVIVNNAGVYTARGTTVDGLDLRFAVNTVAPYVLTKRLLDTLGPDGRVVNVSSAAQAPVSLDALAGRRPLSDGAAYAQSKLAITAWTRWMAEELGDDGPLLVSVNPGSMLASKMVKQAFGVLGRDITVGADILMEAAVGASFEGRSGAYFDNDIAQFGPPHPHVHDDRTAAGITRAVEALAAPHLTA
jgi:NAD(P)-dependent dehydrogenase (short-subunit alcohol dehydrogenase family)